MMDEQAMGAANQEATKAFKLYNKIPAFYSVKVVLGGGDGQSKTNNTQLRPEPFLLKRITWATTGDTLRYLQMPFTNNASWQGATVECRFGDSFTQFMNQGGLITSVFGDSNGFLKLPDGLLFQGSQALEVSLTRLTWPGLGEPEETRFDFVFHGTALLPQGVSASGAAG